MSSFPNHWQSLHNCKSSLDLKIEGFHIIYISAFLIKSDLTKTVWDGASHHSTSVFFFFLSVNTTFFFFSWFTGGSFPYHLPSFSNFKCRISSRLSATSLFPNQSASTIHPALSFSCTVILFLTWITLFPVT